MACLTFVEVGNALVIIRDDRLYRAEHITFESYCRACWQMGRSRAYRLIEASAITEGVSTLVDTLPTTDLRKIVNGLTDLAADDRFSRNREQVAGRNGSDLQRAIDALTRVAELLDLLHDLRADGTGWSS